MQKDTLGASKDSVDLTPQSRDLGSDLGRSQARSYVFGIYPYSKNRSPFLTVTLPLPPPFLPTFPGTIPVHNPGLTSAAKQSGLSE